MSKRLVPISLALMLCVSGAFALTNAGFETGNSNGWAKTVQGVTDIVFHSWNDPTAGVTINAGTGNYSAGFTRNSSNYNGPQASWYRQNVAVTAGQTYIVTVSGRALAYMSADQGWMEGDVWRVGARIALFDGAGPTDQDIDPSDYGSYGKVGGFSQWLGYWDENDEIVSESGVWKDFSFVSTFTATYNFLELRLLIHDKADLRDNYYELAAFDNLAVNVAVVPEPTGLVVLLSGLASLAAYARRRS